MNILYDTRTGKVIKSLLYNNGLHISDALFREPLLVADFTTGTYKASGEDKTFEDLFTFNRAGKAWVNDNNGDLIEFNADEPRISNGLLIEEELTNYALVDTNRTTSIHKLTSLADSKTKIEAIRDYSGQILPETSTPEYPAGQNAGSDKYIYRSVYVHETNRGLLLGRNGDISRRATPGRFIKTTNGAGNVLHRQYRMGVGTFRFSTVTSVLGDYAIYSSQMYCLVDSPSFVAEPILAASSPVTRPADYLSINVIGKTVTGDWDSTLKISIVDGQLVHSGYGRIRKLEVR